MPYSSWGALKNGTGPEWVYDMDKSTERIAKALKLMSHELLEVVTLVHFSSEAVDADHNICERMIDAGEQGLVAADADADHVKAMVRPCFFGVAVVR